MTRLPEPARTAPLMPSSVAPGREVQHVVEALPEVPPGAEVRIAEYRDYGGIPVPVYVIAQPVQATPPRDLTPQPLLDPMAQRLIGGGALAAGIGWGTGEMLGALAAVPASTLVALLAVVLALRARAARTIVHNRNTTHVHQRAGWLGRNTNTTEITN